MPPSSSLSTSSSSVFGRLTGKRQTHEQPPPPLAAGGTLSPQLPFPGEGDRGRPRNGHRRESSILSLTSSVTDLGHNVRRSVSLRSHRTQNSGSGSLTSSGHKLKLSSSGHLPSSLTTSPVEDDEPPPPFEASPQRPRPSRSRGKLSRSARSLSSKFKSTETLPSLVQPDQSDGVSDRPATSADSNRTPTSMIPAPALPRRAPPEKPTIQLPTGYTRDISTSHGPNGAQLQHTATLPLAPAGSHNPHAVYQQIHETAAKRMATMDYLRKVHEGNVFYFGTLSYPPAALSTLPSLNPVRMARRANNYLVLGYSLPAVLDMNTGSPLEYIKALSALLQEFETYQTLSGVDSGGGSLSRGRVGQMFKSGMGLAKGRRASAATEGGSSSATSQGSDLLGLPRAGHDPSSPQDVSPVTPTGHDFHHLVTPHLPFEPDFGTTLAALCDTLIDTYAKLLDLVPSPDLCGPGVGEAFAKADKAVRRILVANVVREFEDHTRSSVKGEVAGLGRLVLGGLM